MDNGLSVEVLDESAVVNDEPGYIRLIGRKVEECRPRHYLFIGGAFHS